jgi:hypothetical protein
MPGAKDKESESRVRERQADKTVCKKIRGNTSKTVTVDETLDVREDGGSGIGGLKRQSRVKSRREGDRDREM